jgi:hypothetical protein
MSWMLDGSALACVAADVAVLRQVLLSAGPSGRLLAVENGFVTIKKRCGWGVLLYHCAYAREGERARAHGRCALGWCVPG